MKNAVVFMWNFICDHEKSPLRYIPDFNVRLMVFQLLGWMWALSFSLAIGSQTFPVFSLLGHVVLIGAVAITVATYSAATLQPQMFARWARRPLAHVRQGRPSL